jgi:hypothetical protein
MQQLTGLGMFARLGDQQPGITQELGLIMAGPHQTPKALVCLSGQSHRSQQNAGCKMFGKVKRAVHLHGFNVI